MAFVGVELIPAIVFSISVSACMTASQLAVEFC